jgi:protein-tyrosine phosphatase
MTPEAVAVVAAYGGDPEGFTSTELDAHHVAAADLVLTATRAHRSAVVTLEPTALRRSFTLTEFARTARCRPPASGAAADATVPAGLPADPVERARAVVATAARWRGTVRPPRPEDDDIPDPIGQPMAVYETIGATIMHAVNTSVAALVGGQP